jgi:diguanylate cyclase
MTRDTQDHIKELEPVLDEYGAWFMQIMRRVFYPSITENKTFNRPQTFFDWVQAAEQGQLIDPGTLLNIKVLHEDMSNLADKLINETLKTQKAPEYDAFDKLATFYEEFINALRRFETDYAVGDIEIDAVTGLRSSGMFYKDTRREMDRLARQGKSFSLALAKIDGFEQIKQSANKQQLEETMKSLAGVIKKSLRSFDDAYRNEGDEFLLSLKQTTASGGLKALHRVRRSLTENPIMLELKGRKIQLSLSSCIGEPLPEDDIRALLVNMRKDMTKYAEPGMVIEYFEMSPLQRLIKEGRE